MKRGDCKNCHGLGLVEVRYTNDFGSYTRPVRCPVCRGTGKK